MTYLTDDELFALPEEPEDAFVAGEKVMRDRLSEGLASADENENTDYATQNYMNNVIALALHCGVEEIASWNPARPGSHNWLEYRQFTAEVDACTMGIRLRTIRRAREYSVALNAATKAKLSHLLSQMRETVEKLDISAAKKDKLFTRINALQEEVDRERTGFHAFGALVIEIADVAGEAAKRLEPVTQMAERIGAAFGLAKREEPPTQNLPSPRERKRLPGPKQSNGFDKSLDDEIPF